MNLRTFFVLGVSSVVLWLYSVFASSNIVLAFSMGMMLVLSVQYALYRQSFR